MAFLSCGSQLVISFMNITFIHGCFNDSFQDLSDLQAFQQVYIEWLIHPTAMGTTMPRCFEKDSRGWAPSYSCKINLSSGYSEIHIIFSLFSVFTLLRLSIKLSSISVETSFMEAESEFYNSSMCQNFLRFWPILYIISSTFGWSLVITILISTFTPCKF